MVTIRQIDFQDPADAATFVKLLNHYACGPFGANKPLDDEVQSVLAEKFAACPAAFAFVAELEGRAVGLATCLEGFSTFRAKPRINVHDLVVHESLRGQGIGRKLLEAVRNDAQQRDACAVTLEVRMDNHAARGLYDSCGFKDVSDPVNDETHLFGVLSLEK